MNSTDIFINYTNSTDMYESSSNDEKKGFGMFFIGFSAAIILFIIIFVSITLKGAYEATKSSWKNNSNVDTNYDSMPLSRHALQYGFPSSSSTRGSHWTIDWQKGYNPNTAEAINREPLSPGGRRLVNSLLAEDTCIHLEELPTETYIVAPAAHTEDFCNHDVALGKYV